MAEAQRKSAKDAKNAPKTESESEADDVIYVDSQPAETIETVVYLDPKQVAKTVKEDVVYPDPVVKAEPVKEETVYPDPIPAAAKEEIVYPDPKPEAKAAPKTVVYADPKPAVETVKEITSEEDAPVEALETAIEETPLPRQSPLR